MWIKEYLKKEIYKHYILCSIPFITMILTFICQMISINDGEQEELIWGVALMLYAILFSVGIILISIEVYSYNKYKKMILLFSKEELERINNEAKTAYNMGKLLITNDVVIFFGFFNKKVIPTKIIEGVDKVEATYTAKGRGLSMDLDYKNIILKCTNNERVMIPAPKNYNYIECENCKKIIKYLIKNKKLNNNKYININLLEEASIFKKYKEFRLSNIMEFFVAIPYLLICLIINRVIETCITNSSNFVLKTFYSIGIKDFLFSIELVIYTIIFTTLYVYYKVYDKNIVKGNTAAKYFKLPMLSILLLFCYIFIGTANYDYKIEARSDYVSYLKNEGETYTGKIVYDKDENKKSYGNCFKGYYDGKIIYLFAKDKVLVSIEGSIDENKIYKIIYLPKTHLIVNINEKTD